MSEIRIRRTGQQALKFHGERIASATGKWHAAVEQNRWYDLEVYRTEGGKIVVAASYETRWQGEESQCAAEIVDSAAEIVDALRNLKADLDTRTAEYGYPHAQQFAGKQARLLATLRAIWDSRVSEVLATLGLEEVVQ